MRIPLYIDFNGKKVVIIGGGGVGTTRAKKFIEAGAEVVVYSLKFSEDLVRLSNEGKVKLVSVDIEKINFEKILRNAQVVVVAIGDKSYNEKIVEVARRYKTLVNLANDAEKTEVVVPFEGGRNGIRFAVTTEGKSGVVARKVKEAFQKVLEEDEEILYFLNAMEYLKKYMKSREVPVNLRMKLYYVVSSDEKFRKLVKEQKVEEARKYVEDLVGDYMSGKKELNVETLEF